MFGLFKKIASDEIWLSTAMQMAPYVQEAAENLRAAGVAVGRDHVYGWREVSEFLGSLDELESRMKSVDRSLKAVGKPSASSPLKQALDAWSAFKSQLLLAVHWGKHHYKDASGSPGQRAVVETGFAQRAALKRINNNGDKFATAALRASAFASDFVRMTDGSRA